MNKEELLQEVSAKISSGELSREEVISRLNLAPAAQQEESVKKVTRFSVTRMLYVLGAAIVVVGIIIFVTQIWKDIGSVGRISVTLGLGLIAAAAGSALLKQKPNDNIGSVFHFIGGILIPGGAVVFLRELVGSFVSPWLFVITFGIIFIFYLLLGNIQKRPILTFFSIVNGTALVYLFVNALIVGPSGDLYAYLTMIIGTSYLLLAHAFVDGWNKSLVGALCFFGITSFLGAAFSQVSGSIPWQLLYFLLVLGGLFLSVYMKSRSILVMSTLFLIAHISFITSKYFAGSLGWPISLVILGFMCIGLGYVSLAINKKYIGKINKN